MYKYSDTVQEDFHVMREYMELWEKAERWEGKEVGGFQAPPRCTSFQQYTGAPNNRIRNWVEAAYERTKANLSLLSHPILCPCLSLLSYVLS